MNESSRQNPTAANSGRQVGRLASPESSDQDGAEASCRLPIRLGFDGREASRQRSDGPASIMGR